MGREIFFFKIPSNHISAWQCVSNIVFSPSDCTSEHCKMYEVYPHYCIFPLYRKYHQTEHYDKMIGENAHLINTQKVPVNKITLSSTPSRCYSTDVLSFIQSFTQTLTQIIYTEYGSSWFQIGLFLSEFFSIPNM